MSMVGVFGRTLEFFIFEKFYFFKFSNLDFHIFDNMTQVTVWKFKKLGVFGKPSLWAISR